MTYYDEGGVRKIYTTSDGRPISREEFLMECVFKLSARFTELERKLDDMIARLPAEQSAQEKASNSRIDRAIKWLLR